MSDDILWHQSGVNKDGEPFVQLIRGTAVVAQMSPAQARDHALAILEAAEASEQDAFLVHWTKTVVGGSPQAAAGLLKDFRNWRREQTGKRSGQEVIPENKNRGLGEK